MTTRKGRKERQSKTPEVAIEEQLKEKEIVKGLYESKWLKLLEKDDVTRYIRNIVEEIAEISSAIIQYKASEEKTFSYSVEWARQLMLETIECYFLTHDPGQPDPNNPLWTSDKEPGPPVIDCWARGMMPMEMGLMTDQECEDMLDNISCDESLSLEGEMTMSPSQQNETPIEANTNSPSSVQTHTNLKRDTRPIARRFRDKDTPIMTVLPQPFNMEAVEEETITEQWKTESHVSVVRSHTPPSPTAQLAIPPTITTHRDHFPLPHKRSEIVTDAQGKVIYTTYLKSTKFPSQNIRPRVSIPQTSIVSYEHQDNWKLPSESKQRHRHIHWQQANVQLPKVKQEKGGLKRVESNRFQQKPSLPPLVDLIDPLPGVTVKENERTIIGHSSPRSRARSPRHHLKPITPHEISVSTRDSEDCVNKLTIK